MSEDAAGGGAVLQSRRAQAEELEATGLPRDPIDQDVGELVGAGWVHDRDALDRVLCTLLRVDALRDEVQIGVEEGQVVVVGCRAEGIVPMQDAGESSSCRADDVL